MNYTKNLIKIIISIISILFFILIYSKESIVIINTDHTFKEIYLEDFYYIIDNNKVIIQSYKGNSSRVIIPSKIENMTVTGIYNTIYDNKSIKTLILPSTIEMFDYITDTSIDIECVSNKLCHDLLDSGLNVTQIEEKDFDFYNSADDFEYLYENDSTYIIGIKNQNNVSVTIPSVINGFKVNKVNLSNIRSFIINVPNGIEQIGTPKSSITFIFYIVNIILLITLTIMYLLINKSNFSVLFLLVSDILLLFYKLIDYNIFYMLIIEIIIFITYLFISKNDKKNLTLMEDEFIKKVWITIKNRNITSQKLKNIIINSTVYSNHETYFLEQEILNNLKSMDFSKKENIEDVIIKLNARNKILNNEKTTIEK